MGTDGDGAGTQAPVGATVASGFEVWGYLRVALSVIGGSTVLVGAFTAAGMAAHATHLRMLGLPIVELSPRKYASTAFDFFVDSLWLGVSTRGPLAWWVIGLCALFCFLVLGWAQAHGDQDNVTWRRRWVVHAPTVCTGLMLGGVAFGAWLLVRCGPALAVKDLLWSVSRSAEAGSGATSVWQPPSIGIRSQEIAIDLLRRSQSADDADVSSNSKSTEARARLRGRYGQNVLHLIFLLLWLLTAWYVKGRAAQTQTTETEWTPILRGTCMVFELAAAVVVATALLLLPINYGVLVLETTYPVQVTQEARAPNDGEAVVQPDSHWVPQRTYFISALERDAKQIYVLCCETRQVTEGPRLRWVLARRSLVKSGDLPMEDLGDVLSVVRAEVPEAAWQLWEERMAAGGGWIARVRDWHLLVFVGALLALATGAAARWVPFHRAADRLRLCLAMRPHRPLAEAPSRPPAERPQERRGEGAPATKPRWEGLVAFVIVVCVAGLVASALFPVFAGARSEARQAGCLSNVRQLTTATGMYATDWDERLPLAPLWCDGTLLYTTNEQFYHCPEASAEGGAGAAAEGARWSNYAYNAALHERSPTDVMQAAQFVLLFDATGARWNLSGGPDRIAPRHDQGFNAAFVDGHASRLDHADWDLYEWFLPNEPAAEPSPRTG